MEFFRNLIRKKSDVQVLDELSLYYLAYLDQIIGSLQSSDAAIVISARETLGAFQSAFTNKFKSTSGYLASPLDVRKG